MKSVKVWNSYEDQFMKLCDRECVIADRSLCIENLGKINYYRLTGYFSLFRDKTPGREDKYLPGTTFDKILAIYNFDSKLRFLLMIALEKIEIFFRTQVAYYHSGKYGALGYLDASNHNRADYHAGFVSEFQSIVDKDNHTVFLNHHKKEYGGVIPLWVAVELFPFGMLSKYYNNWLGKDKKGFSGSFYFYTNPKGKQDLTGTIASWIHCCSVLRNMCAHYSRLYDNKFNSSPNFKNANYDKDYSLFPQILAVRACYPGNDEWNNDFVSPLRSLINEYSQQIELSRIGFPVDWEKIIVK